MAELTINGWDGKTDPSGAARVLRDECNMQIKDARTLLELCQRGVSRKIQVPFAKREAVKKALEARGFRTS